MRAEGEEEGEGEVNLEGPLPARAGLQEPAAEAEAEVGTLAGCQ